MATHPKTKQITGTRDRQAAQYISEMILELRNIAKAEHLANLQGLLELTYYEAYSAANRVDIPPDEIQKLQDMAKDARRAAITA
jgi:hypothetical protein